MLFYYSSGGALMCEIAIPGVTQDLAAHESWNPTWYDGYRYFVAESMTKEAARRIAHSLGGMLIEANVPPARQLIAAAVDVRRELTRLAVYGVHPRKRSPLLDI